MVDDIYNKTTPSHKYEWQVMVQDVGVEPI